MVLHAAVWHHFQSWPACMKMLACKSSNFAVFEHGPCKCFGTAFISHGAASLPAPIHCGKSNLLKYQQGMCPRTTESHSTIAYPDQPCRSNHQWIRVLSMYMILNVQTLGSAAIHDRPETIADDWRAVSLYHSVKIQQLSMKPSKEEGDETPTLMRSRFGPGPEKACASAFSFSIAFRACIQHAGIISYCLN